MTLRAPALLAAILVIVSGAVCLAAPTEDSDADPVPYTVTDGKGHIVKFDAVPAHIMAIGKGITATVIELGGLDKIVVTDRYSATADEPLFDDLRSKVASNDIYGSGSVYSSGKENLLHDILDALDEKDFSISSDVVLIAGSDTYVQSIYSELADTHGFKKVLWWNDITEYDEVCTFVGEISKVISGTEGSVSASMRAVLTALEECSPADPSEHPKAFYITYSGGAFKVGNKGSLADSMIIAAGGVSLTRNREISTSTYDPQVTTTIPDLAHEATAIFVDAGIVLDQARYNELRTLIGSANQSKIVEMESLWNNYCPQSIDGVIAMNDKMYNSTPGGDSNGSGGCLGLIVAVLVSGIAAVSIPVATGIRGRI